MTDADDTTAQSPTDQRGPHEVAAELIEMLWDEKAQAAAARGSGEIPNFGMMTATMDYEGRKFQVAVYELDDEQEQEQGLTTEEMLRILMYRTSKIAWGIDDMNSRIMQGGLGGNLASFLAGMADAMHQDTETETEVAEPREYVVGPTVDTTDLVINQDAIDTDLDDYRGTFGLGYRELVELLGPPMEQVNAPLRTDAQWNLVFTDDGTWAVIYNLDDGPVTHGADGPTLDDLDTFRVTATNLKTVERVAALFEVSRTDGG